MKIRRFLTSILLFILFIPVVYGQKSKTVNIALVSVKNLDTSPQFDYLGGMIQGLLLYDYTKTPGVAVVDRQSLDRVFNEQQLQSTGITGDPDNAAKMGKILGVNFFITVDYVVMGQDVLITEKLIAVETGKISVISERGGIENTIHAVADKTAEFLTGKVPGFKNEGSDRSLVTLKDEAPGTITLHSPLVQAEIFIDDEFAGYTAGDVEKPLAFGGVKAGKHKIRVHLGNAWGMIDLPAFRFHDWEETVNVQPGKNHVIRDRTRDFNGQIYELMRIYKTSVKLTGEERNKLNDTIPVSFTDREGRKVDVTVMLNPDFSTPVPSFKPVVVYNGSRQKIQTLVPLENKDNEFVFTVEKIKCSLELDTRLSPNRVEFTIERTDIWQGMFDDEKKK